MNYDIILKELFKKNRMNINLGLERISILLEKLKNPHLGYKTIHIAGTNGKGSTSTMLASILQSSGYKVGLYTSPFIVDFKESISINKKIISNKEVEELYSKINPFIEDLTYFEIKTAMAFLYFTKQNVDVAVIETGLGGEFDATNVIIPEVSIITKISLDHKEILGDTIEEIAKAKAGIIKKNIPLITVYENSKLNSIKDKVKEMNSELIIVKKPKNKIKINLIGDFQQINANLAIKALSKTSFKISDEAILSGLNNLKIRGRFEIINNIIFDCAHNPDAIKTILPEVKKINKGKLIVVTSILNDKDKEEMIKLLEQIASILIITDIKNSRVCNPDLLASYSKKAIICKDSYKALNKAKLIANKNDTILVTGSCYLIGEIIKKLKRK